MPKPTSVTYIYGRINLISAAPDKRALITSGIGPSSPILKKYAHQWGFFDIDTVETRIGPVISGFLVKLKAEYPERIAIPETKELSLETLANYVVARARFFVHLDSGLIAFHPAGQHITKQVFTKRFVELIESSNNNFFINAEIMLIEEPMKLLEVMRAFSRIEELAIYLHPSNPSNRERWRRIDERLRALQAAKTHQTYTARPDTSLRIEEDEELLASITMAEDGYGEAQLRGTIEGRRRVVRTRDNPVSAQAAGDDSPSDVTLEGLLKGFEEILSRFRE
jgi:hypothetical protein